MTGRQQQDPGGFRPNTWIELDEDLHITSPQSPDNHRPDSDSITSKSTSKIFRFLDLPGEIQNMIYRCALTDVDSQTSKLLIRKDFYAESVVQKFYNSIKRPHVNLLLVCRKTFKEANHILYECNQFNVHGNRCLQKLLGSIGSNQHLLRDLDFHTRIEDFGLRTVASASMLSNLVNCTGLKALTISLWIHYERGSVNHQITAMSHAFIPFCRMIAERDGLEKLFSVIRFEAPRQCHLLPANIRGRGPVMVCVRCWKKYIHQQTAESRFKDLIISALTKPTTT